MNEDILYEYVRKGILEIDSSGRIWRKAKMKWNTGTKSNDIVRCNVKRAERLHKLYYYVRVGIGKKQIWAQAHRLVWRHFNGPIPEGMTINHKNGIPTCNELSNLELATPREQVWHARHILLKPCGFNVGEQHYKAKLTDAEVESIRQLKKDGMRGKDIASLFNVYPSFVCRITKGQRRVPSKNWRNLPPLATPSASAGDTCRVPSPAHDDGGSSSTDSGNHSLWQTCGSAG